MSATSPEHLPNRGRVVPEKTRNIPGKPPIEERLPWRCTECGTRDVEHSPMCPRCRARDSMMFAPTPDDVVVAEATLGPWDIHRLRKGKEEKSSLVIDPSSADDRPLVRVPTGLRGFDDILCGGLALATSGVLTGRPGAGKSRLMLGVMHHVSREHVSMFVAGEMGAGTVRMAREIGAVRRGRLHIIDSDDLGKAFAECGRRRARIVVVDSLHRVRLGKTGDPGTPTQIRAVMRETMTWAREHDACVILLAHATKGGEFKGDSAGEHDPDVTLRLRMLRDPFRQLVCDKTRLGGPRGKRAWLRFDATGRLCDGDRPKTAVPESGTVAG